MASTITSKFWKKRLCHTGRKSIQKWVFTNWTLYNNSLHSILTQYSRWHDLWRPPTFLRWQDLITPTTNLMNTLHKFEFKTFLILMKHPEQNCFYIVILNTGNICINTYYIYILFTFIDFIILSFEDQLMWWYSEIYICLQLLFPFVFVYFTLLLFLFFHFFYAFLKIIYKVKP